MTNCILQWSITWSITSCAISLHPLHDPESITSCPISLHQLHDPEIDYMFSVVAVVAAANAASPHQCDYFARGKQLFFCCIFSFRQYSSILWSMRSLQYVVEEVSSVMSLQSWHRAVQMVIWTRIAWNVPDDCKTFKQSCKAQRFNQLDQSLSNTELIGKWM